MSQNAETGKLVLPLHAEHLDVTRRRVVTGNVRVSTRVATREQQVDELLCDEQAQIERVACNRFVDEMPAVREEGDTTIVPVVEEVVTVVRRLFLKEEVRIRRVRVEHHHRETVVLRAQEAVITHGDTNDVVDNSTQSKP